MTDDLHPDGSAAGPDGGSRPTAGSIPGEVPPSPAPGAGSGDPAQPGPAQPAPAQPAPAQPAPARPGAPVARRTLSPVLGYLGVAIIGIAIGAVGLTLADRGGIGSPATPEPGATALPSAVPGLTADSVGSSTAPATIEVWADYQCSFCRLEDLLFGGALEREYVIPGEVRIVYRDFAFLGAESVDAAVAARCAGRQEPAAQLRYHDALYTFQQGVNQGRFVRDNLLQVAEIVGLGDIDAFRSCLDDPAVEAAVRADLEQGRGLGLDSTPTLRLSGPGGEVTLRGFSQTWPTLRDAVEGVLGRRPLPSPTVEPSPEATAAPAATPGASPSSTPGASPSVTPTPSG